MLRYILSQTPYFPHGFDSANTAVLPFVAIADVVPTGCQPGEIDDSEVARIDSLLPNAMYVEHIGDGWPLPEQKGRRPRPLKEILSRYKRQLVCYRNENNEKIVWINCFCIYTSDEHWKEYFLQGMDGGDCFFNLKLNLANKKVFDVHVNVFPTK